MSKESFHRNNTCAKEISSLGLPSRQVERAASVISLPPVLLKKMKMFFLCRITVLTFFLPLYTTCSPHHQLLHSDQGKVSLHPAPQKASCQPEILFSCWVVAQIISPRQIWKYCVDMQNHCLWSRSAAGLCSLLNWPRDEEEDHE